MTKTIITIALLFITPCFTFAQTESGYFKSGNSFYENGDYDKAIVEFTKAIQVMPKSADVYLQRGLMYWIQGNEIQSSSDFKKAAQLDSKYREIFYDLPEATKFKKDIALYTDEIKRIPKSSEAYLNRGRTYAEHHVISRNKSEYAHALADYDKAIELDPKNEVALKNREGLIANKDK